MILGLGFKVARMVPRYSQRWKHRRTPRLGTFACGKRKWRQRCVHYQGARHAPRGCSRGLAGLGEPIHQPLPSAVRSPLGNLRQTSSSKPLESSQIKAPRFWGEHRGQELTVGQVQALLWAPQLTHWTASPYNGAGRIGRTSSQASMQRWHW